MTTRAVIFDLDGTLVHSAPDLHAAAVAMLAGLGRRPVTLKQVTGFVGDGVPKLVERCLRATGGVPADGGRAALACFSAHYDRDPVRLTRLYPGVAQALGQLAEAGLALAICTNKPEAAAHKVLAGMGLAGLFPLVVGGDTLSVNKPDPAVIDAVLGGLRARRDQALYVGDSETDEATTRAACLPFALFTGGYRKTPVDQMHHDWTFDSYAELPGRLLARV